MRRHFTTTRQALRVILALGLTGVSGDARSGTSPTLPAALSVCRALGDGKVGQGGQSRRLEQHIATGGSQMVKTFAAKDEIREETGRSVVASYRATKVSRMPDCIDGDIRGTREADCSTLCRHAGGITHRLSRLLRVVQKS